MKLEPGAIYNLVTASDVEADYSVQLVKVDLHYCTVELFEHHQFEGRDRIASIDVKWDGCSHVTWEHNLGALHLCGGSGWRQFGAILNRVFQLAFSQIEKGNSECAEFGEIDTSIEIEKISEPEHTS